MKVKCNLCHEEYPYEPVYCNECGEPYSIDKFTKVSQAKTYTRDEVCSILGFVRTKLNVNGNRITNSEYIDKWIEQNL